LQVRSSRDEGFNYFIPSFCVLVSEHL
jgi:hypothetical protein